MKKIYIQILIVFIVLCLIVFLDLNFRIDRKLNQNDINSQNQITKIKNGFGQLFNFLSSKENYQPQQVSVKKIFADEHSFVATVSASHLRTIIASGDVIPARSVNYETVTRNDFTWAFKNTASLLNQADITLINLESPLIENCLLTNEGMIFCGDVRNIEGLVFAGVDIANLANNHIGNYGDEGIFQTIERLRQNHILVSGVKTPAVIDVRGIRFGFLGYNDIGITPDLISNANSQNISDDIKKLKLMVDIIVVSFSWGEEYTRQPTIRQKELAHLAIDSGADLIIGNHPHWIQPVEIYRGKLIMYAHGNFIFDQMWSEETKLGVVGKYTFFDKELIDVQYLPIKIIDYGQPYVLYGNEKNSIMQMLLNESIILADKI